MEYWKSEILDNCPIINECMSGCKSVKWDLDLFRYYTNMCWMEICTILRNKIAPSFWKQFQHSLLNDNNDNPSTMLIANNYDDIDNEFISNTIINSFELDLFERFVSAVDELHHYYENIMLILKEFNDKIFFWDYINTQKRLNYILHSILLAQLPTHFNKIVYAFCNVSLKLFLFEKLKEKVEEIEFCACLGCLEEPSKCCCSNILLKTYAANLKLSDMKLLDRLTGQCITTLVKLRIKDHIVTSYEGQFYRTNLQDIFKWLDDVIINWLKQIFQPSVDLTIEDDNSSGGVYSDSVQPADTLNNLKVKLYSFIYETYALSIVEQFIAVIIEYPDSIPAIADLKICMENVKLNRDISLILKNSLETRLLHPGVNTMNILTAYVAAIKTIRYLDNTGVILETVTSPIKEYLRKRSDTVRCVVQSLTEETPTDLSEELAKMLNIDDGLSNWEMWQPQPSGIGKTNSQTSILIKKVRPADIISMVVDIYGSKELFMTEYRNLLANRLLTQVHFRAEKEIRNLELLKLRFGEMLLHNCEVMLKDMTDSKRIDNHVQNDANYLKSRKFPITALIISAQFWPAFNKESVQLPEEIAEEFQKYTKSFEEYKGNRTLNWRTVSGRVKIEIELCGRVIEMTVSPTQLVILYHFQKTSEWSLDELSNAVQIPPSVLKRRMSFWQRHGLLRESENGIYKLNESKLPDAQLTEHKSPLRNVLTEEEEEDNESAMISTSDQREEELQVFWSYIVGMLTNLDSLPLERIHQMLKLFASNGLGVEFSQDELKLFLQSKVCNHKLVYAGGSYQLPK